MLKVRKTEAVLVVIALLLCAGLIAFSVINNSKAVVADVSYDTSAVSTVGVNTTDSAAQSDTSAESGSDATSAENSTTALKTESKNTTKSVFSGVVNINTASADELCQLNGIGEVLAGRIIEYRNKNGKFSAIDDIMNVSGIGEKKFEKIKGNICVE